MQAIASLIQDDPYLTTPKEQRIADRVRRRELFRWKPQPIAAIVPVVEIEPPAPELVPEKQLWFSVDADLGPITPKAVRIDDIIRVVCKYFDVSKQDILSDRRTATIVLPRQVCGYLARIFTLKSLPEIGRRLGRKDHSTIHHAIRKITNLVETDQAFAARINILSRQVLNVD